MSIKDMPRRGIIETTERRISDVAQSNVFKREPVAAGTLLMAFKLSVGKTAILGIDSFHNEAIASLHVSDAVLKRYLLWALPALASHAAANPAIMGTTLNSSTIARVWVPIPPAQEQERLIDALVWVAGLIDEIADASMDLRDAADESLKLLAQGRAMSHGQTSMAVFS